MAHHGRQWRRGEQLGAEWPLNFACRRWRCPACPRNYLASLGLLRVLSRTWPSTRIAWREEVLQVVGGAATLDELLDEVVRVAATQAEMDTSNREWTLLRFTPSDTEERFRLQV